MDANVTQQHQKLPNVQTDFAGQIHASQLWSTIPQCFKVATGSDIYCLYTSVCFAEGRGLSIIAKPDQATKLLALPAFWKPNIHVALGANSVLNPYFVTTNIEGKGVGVVADRFIQRGQWLMSFTPALVMAKPAVQDLQYMDRLHLQGLAIDQLPLPLRNASYALHARKTFTAHNLVDDILDTNSFEFPLTMSSESGDKVHETDFKFLYPEIARFNHDCRPTADYFLDQSTLVLYVVAFRDVFPGEELTISYIDPLQKRQARQDILRRSWGFDCSCAACSMSYKSAEASDARIDEIMRLQDELVDRRPESRGSPALAEKLIALLVQERLWTLMHDGHSAAAIEYSAIGDAANAQKHALLALQSGWVCRGTEPTDDFYQDLVLLKNNPQSHPSWRFRIPKSKTRI